MSGDEIDVEAAFREHHQSLFRYLVRQSGDPQAAQDAVQDAFVRLHETPPRSAEGLRLWLFRTGLNRLRDQQRATSRHLRLLAENRARVPLPQPVADAEQKLVRKEDRSRVRRALDQLRERERTALLMREEGFKHREIARALDTTTGTVGTLIARSLDKLADLLQEGGTSG